MTKRARGWAQFSMMPAEDGLVRSHRWTQPGDPVKQARWHASILQRHRAYRLLDMHGELPQSHQSTKETPLQKAQRLWQSRGRHANDRRIANKP